METDCKSVHAPKWTVRVFMRQIKRARRRLDTCLIQCVSHTAVNAAVHWSARIAVRQHNADHAACST